MCLQYAATSCNTLQHTCCGALTPHRAYQHGAANVWVCKRVCQTLHHTISYCNTLQHTATHSSTLQYTTTHCNILQHTCCGSADAASSKSTWRSSKTVGVMAAHCTTSASRASFRCLSEPSANLAQFASNMFTPSTPATALTYAHTHTHTHTHTHAHTHAHTHTHTH